MKIAILGTRGIPASYGGFETFAEELSVRLARRGIEVTVYCESTGGEQPAMFKGVHLEYLSCPSLGPLSTILFDLRCLWHARKKYDVVYMLGYGASAFCFIPRLWGTKVWINMDGIEWARSKWNRIAKLWFKLMEWAAIRTADRLIADAKGILRHLQSRHPAMPRCDVIPYGAPVPAESPSPDLLSEWNVSPGKYYLIVCRLEPENSVREIITGYLRSGSRRPLLVVGNASAGTGYVREIIGLADDRVRFIGTLYDKPKLQALRYHTFAYFHGHTVGGTNPSLLEALGCGNLVLAQDNTFNREVADAAGLYFDDARDLPALITRVEAMGREELMEIKRRAQNRVSVVYSWDRIAGRYEYLLTRVLFYPAARPVHE